MTKWKRATIIAILIIVVVIIIPFLINIIFKIDLGVEIFQSEWAAGEALTFYGAIISGGVTFLGVLLTIRYENEKRKKDDSIRYKPILELAGVDIPINCGYRNIGLTYAASFRNDTLKKDEFIRRYSENLCGEIPKYKLYFKNIGRGETFNARIDKYEISHLSWEDISNLESMYSSSQYIGEIVQNGYFGIYVRLPNYLVLPKTHERCKEFKISTKLYISYADMFNIIKYQYILVVHHKIIVDNVEKNAPDVFNSQYQYFKVHYEPYEMMPIKKTYSDSKKKES